MIGRLGALILLSALSQSMDIPQQIPLTVAEPGDTLNLTCPITGDQTGLFYWYKVKFGYMVQTVAGGSQYKISLREKFNNSRFSVRKVDGLCVLHIKNVNKDDEATYLCQAGAAYDMTFTGGTVVAVNDRGKQQESVIVEQSPETASVEPGKSVTLQCSLLPKNKETRDQCPDEHSVYWFRSGSGETPPGFIYTHSNSSDKQEERSCSYSLSKTIRNASDSGTYYCAVVTCGKILFGEGTKVETRPSLFPIVLWTVLACCVTAIVIVAIIISRNQKPVCEHRKGEVTAFSHTEDQPSNAGGEEVALNYAAVAFSSKKGTRWASITELQQDSLYSGIRDDQWSVLEE